ncbi:MAG: hypothetical protein ACRDKT_15420 [Actinomycetota bacterium]
MRRVRPLIIVTLLAGLALASSPATAGTEELNRRHPPRIALRYRGEVVQRAAPYTYCWAYEYPDGSGIGTCADGFPRYPKAVTVKSNARLAIRIRYPARPHRWFVHSYRAVASEGGYTSPIGDGERIPFRLRPHRLRGEITAWDVVFSVDEPLRHYYLDTGGDLAQGDVFYALHVRTSL